jgi:hypothetical protein
MSDRVEIEDGVSQCCVKVGRLRGILANNKNGGVAE